MHPAGIRQQPGYACEECRRRKSRCDRARPRCGGCIEYDVECITMGKRQKRGPIKSQIEMMRSRIATLERKLEKQSGAAKPTPSLPTPSSDAVTDISGAAPLLELMMAGSEHTSYYADIDTLSDSFIDQVTDFAPPYRGWPMAMAMPEAARAVVTTGTLDRERSLTSPSQLSTIFWEQYEPEDVNSATEPGEFVFSDLIRADLDDVYFDRVHHFCPMVHQQRYFVWATQKNPSTARACLRSAMRTLAAVMSAPYGICASVLYVESRHMLEESRRANDTPGTNWPAPLVKVEYVQAWILLAHYESLRVYKWQAMMTAGYAFRLIQMYRLHEIDGPRSDGDPLSGGFETSESFEEIEERRRTFWVAYTLDYFLCWRSGWPLTLYEDMIRTRLPAPERSFQTNQPVTMDYLADAITRAEPTMLSLFSESIILATLHSRCMTHCKTAAFRQDPAVDNRERYELLAATVEKRVKLLGKSRMTPARERDQMLFFVHMLAHSAIICLGGGGAAQRTWQWEAVENNNRNITDSWEQRALKAVAEISQLIRAQSSFNCFKAHPFLPNPLASGIAFLTTQRRSLGDDADVEAETLSQMLRDLRDVNNVAQ
ncbi:hypothetical protein GGR52DRAFT_585386 [Hypoxylon sp. FL1284]|nr:hypothetical protein GGR52DRAFT_585386 [Hypoxylon sp. FL1284]